MKSDQEHRQSPPPPTQQQQPAPPAQMRPAPSPSGEQRPPPHAAKEAQMSPAPPSASQAKDAPMGQALPLAAEPRPPASQAKDAQMSPAPPPEGDPPQPAPQAKDAKMGPAPPAKDVQMGSTPPSPWESPLAKDAKMGSTPPPVGERPPPLRQEPAPGLVVPSENPNALVSGGGISFLTGDKNARFSYGYSSFKGKRASMEDYYETRISEVDGHMVALFGVFDGHGGYRTAEYLKKNLFKNLSSHPNFIRDTKSAIVEAFRQTDTDYLDEEKGQQKDAGSTASTAVLVRDRVYVANVGDSRVVACRAGSAIPLSIDHKPDRSDERERIEEAGGFIVWAGTWRVGGVLAVSRAFGDKLLRPYVVAEPEIQEQEIDGVEFIIVASDGLWNVLSNKDAVNIVQDIADAEAASRKLIEEAYGRGSSDNITCVVVRFET